MTEPDNIILVYLRRISEQMEALREDVREIKTRLGILEQQGASLSSRIDRVEMRLDRIERRLDLQAQLNRTTEESPGNFPILPSSAFGREYMAL
eukprot:gene20139-20686_t